MNMSEDYIPQIAQIRWVQPEHGAAELLELLLDDHLRGILEFLRSTGYSGGCHERLIASMSDGRPELQYHRTTALPEEGTRHTFYQPVKGGQRFSFVGEGGIAQLADLIQVVIGDR